MWMIEERRYDRGTGAMHLANTPVVSPESKNPALAGFSLYSNCSLFVAAIVAQLMPSMNELSDFLARFQLHHKKIALIAKKWFIKSIQIVVCVLPKRPLL